MDPYSAEMRQVTEWAEMILQVQKMPFWTE